MNRPRRSFGSTRPGQLLATRIKVLAAELSDPDRLRRGRTYASNGSVVDIAVDAGVATGTVLGSRSDPYLVELVVEPGDGPPVRSELSVRCTCPDADLQFGSWCKHALATLLVIADEVAIEPNVLDRWRGNVTPDADADADGGGSASPEPTADRPDAAHQPAATSTASATADATRRHRQPGGERQRGSPPRDDALDEQLTVPLGAVMPLIPDVAPVPRAIVTDDGFDRILADAIAILTAHHEGVSPPDR